MSATETIIERRMVESMRLVVEAAERCEANLRCCEHVPTEVWAVFEHATSIARQALDDAELELFRPAKPHRREVEDLAVQCDRLLSSGEVRP